MPLTDAVGGQPFATMAVPGRDLGLQLLLAATTAGLGVLVVLPYQVTGTDADGDPITADFDAVALARRRDGRSAETLGIIDRAARTSATTRCSSPSADPGQGIVWMAFVA